MQSTLQSIALFAVALVGAWIAARQMVIADDRLRMDNFNRLYTKRVAVYEATREILAQVFRGGVSEDDLREFGLIALDAQFIFDDTMYQYLREMRQRLAEMNIVASKDAADNDDFLRNKRSDNLKWFVEQGDEHTGFATRFRPFLVLDFPLRARWLRWPN